MKSIAATVLSLSMAGSPVAQAEDELRLSRAVLRPSNAGSTAHFTGKVRISRLFTDRDVAGPTKESVTFEPGARSAWHTHDSGQTLIVTAGSGRIQRWGGLVEKVQAGDVVWIPSGQKHWHGAAPAVAMTYVAIHESMTERDANWFEKVTASDYLRAEQPSTGRSSG